MPRWTLPNIVQNLRFPHVPLSLHRNSLPLCQVPLFITRQSVFTRLHINGRKCSSLMLLWCFSFSCLATETLQIVVSTQRLFWSRDLACWGKKRTTQLSCRWFSNSRAQSPCTQTNLLDGNQLLFSVTKLIFISSSTTAQVNAFQRFLEIQILGTRGFEPGLSRTEAECSTTELYPLECRKSTKDSVFTRIHGTGKKASVLGVTMNFIALLLRKPTQVLQISFSTQRIVFRDLAYRK